MLVVSDSSPINFLVRMRQESVLVALFGRVVIPPAVAQELSRPATPPEVAAFIGTPPAWLEIRTPATIEPIPKLQIGEQAAISLARELHADLILIDDGDARRAATARGLAITGLLGVLERADERRLINLESLAPSLPHDYRIDPALLETAIERARLRRARIT